MQKHGRRDAIPFEEIDVEVRGVVELLNLFPDIQTLSSCAGHEPGAESYVAFSIGSLARLHEIVQALPFLGSRAAIWRGRPAAEALYILVEPGVNGAEFSLRIWGRPKEVHRQLIGKVECALANVLRP